MNKDIVAKVIAVLIAIPVILLISIATVFLVGFIGYGMGWLMELIGSPIIYAVLDVVPTQPFSKGDFPKLWAMTSVLFGLGVGVGVGQGGRD